MLQHAPGTQSFFSSSAYTGMQEMAPHDPKENEKHWIYWMSVWSKGSAKTLIAWSFHLNAF